VKLMLPMGFALLALQGLSELIKRVAALTDSYRLEYGYETPLQ
jgi:TRAP-type mannitol/chloroaromatic compound transport system permease small subunit